MILHNCRLISGFLKFTYVKKKIDIAHLQAYKWSFTFTHEKKRNEIAHLGDHKWYIHICEKKNG